MKNVYCPKCKDANTEAYEHVDGMFLCHACEEMFDVVLSETTINFAGLTIVEKELAAHPLKGSTSLSIFVPFSVEGVELVPGMDLHRTYLDALIFEATKG